MNKTLWQIQTSFSPERLFTGPDYFCVVTSKALHFFSASDGVSLLPPQTALGDFSLTEYTVVGGAATSSGNLLITLLPFRLPHKACLLSLKLIGQDAEQTKQLLCQQIYEAPGTQLSAPVIDTGDRTKVYLIQQGPELTVIDSERSEVQRTISLPAIYNLHRNCVSFAMAANRLCLALCDSSIVTLDPQTGRVLATLRKSTEGYQLSPLATDGMRLFFGTFASKRSPSPSRISALDVTSGQEVWNFEIPADPSGRHRSIGNQPLVVHNYLYVAGHNCLIHALDMDTGHELWNYKMPSRVEFGPAWTGKAIVVMDQQGGIHALQVNEPPFVVTCHYDPKTPPILDEWNPLIFTLINTSNYPARSTVLRLSGDFEGISEHHTQQLHTIPPGDFRRCNVYLKPTAAGSAVHLAVAVDYLDNQPNIQKLDLYIGVRRSGDGDDASVQNEIETAQYGDVDYNYTALRALLAAIPKKDLTDMCFDHFRPVYDSFNPGMNKTERIRKLVEYAHRYQQTQELLTELRQRNPIRYEQYIQEIEHPVHLLEVSLAHNSPPEFKPSSQLYKRLHSVLSGCEEFDSVVSLRTVMSIAPLRIYQSEIRFADTREELVSLFLTDFQCKRFSDGRLVLPLFLRTLRGKHQEDKDIYDSLTEILGYMPGGGEPLPVQPSLSAPEASFAWASQIHVAELMKLLQASQSIGKLTVTQYQNGKPVFNRRETGTAWLVAPGLALTSWHIINARDHKEGILSETDLTLQAANAQLTLGFTAPGVGWGYEIELVHANRDRDTLDYALLRLKDWDGRYDYLPINIHTALVGSTDLYVVNHSQGQPLQVTRGPCLGASLGRVLYGTATAPGASGSPVFDVQSLAVVAMHCGRDHQGTPEGIRLRSILEDLYQQTPAIHQEIIKAQQKKGVYE